MVRFAVMFAAVLTTGIVVSNCGGSASSGVTGPTPPAAPPGAVTVSIVGSAGSGAFAPNPVQVAAGNAIVWRNDDPNIHHIVLDDGSADLGTVVPGATTRSVTVTDGAAIGFHCTIHPSMVGTINGTATANPGAPYTADNVDVN